jgi:hypothetical protein
MSIIEQIVSDSKKTVAGGIRSLLFMNDYVLEGIAKLQSLDNPVVHRMTKMVCWLIENWVFRL